MAHFKSDSDQEAQILQSGPVGKQRWQEALADTSPLAMGGFATTLLTLSLAMLNLRGVTLQAPMFVADLCFVAGFGLFISAQWEMLRGNTFSYTVLGAFGCFYGGYGFILIPATGVAEYYGGTNTDSYNNAMGFFILMWAVFNLFFLLASTRLNAVYVGVFTFIELCLIFDASSYFAAADGKAELGVNFMKASGAFGFIASLLGYYTVLHYLCQDALPFPVPLGDFKKYRARKQN